MINFEREEKRITTEEVKYWSRMVKSNLKIGVEVEFDLHGGGSSIRREIEDALGVSNNVSVFGKGGVQEVTTDGSIPGGLEVKMVGRRIDFLDMYMTYMVLYETIKERAFVNERCGLHNHVLMDYGRNHTCLEKPMPEIIMMNFLQILRKHGPEIVWLTSTIKDDNAITRYSYFCEHSNLYRYTPITRNIGDYKYALSSDSRYQFINLRPMQCSDEGSTISKLHFELRFPDGSIYPAQIAGQNVLYAAMFMKAIEMSEIGVMTTGSQDHWDRTKNLINSIRNTHNVGSRERVSVGLSPGEEDEVRARGAEFLKFLKPSLDMFDSHVYQVLYFLNEKPISLMRRTMSDSEIVNCYHDLIKNMYTLDAENYTDIIKAIVSQEITGCYNEIDWMHKASEPLNCKNSDLRTKLYELNRIKPLRFDKVVGSFVFM